MDLHELVIRAHMDAKAAGWWDAPVRTDLEAAALIHTEVSEFVEDMRTPPHKRVWLDSVGWGRYGAVRETETGIKLKPVGPLSELADVVIRIADLCGSKGWDLDAAIVAKLEFNRTRGHRHGGKVY